MRALAGCLWPTGNQRSHATLDVEDGSPAGDWCAVTALVPRLYKRRLYGSPSRPTCYIGHNETFGQSQGTQSMEVRVLPERTTCRPSVEQGSSSWLYPIVVWGKWRLWSNIHASAPNKRLRRLLSKYIPVILSSEYRSSQRSACCHSHLKNRPSPKRVTVKQCTTCKTLLSRQMYLRLVSFLTSLSSSD
jgi:hypothetical protein